jgi:Uma2 family endonuclease
MESPQERSYTVEAYLALEETALEKHEYLDGRIYAMTGGTARHSRIKTRVIASWTPSSAADRVMSSTATSRCASRARG